MHADVAREQPWKLIAHWPVLEPVRRLMRLSKVVARRDGDDLVVIEIDKPRHQRRRARETIHRRQSETLENPHPSARREDSPERRDDQHVAQLAAAGHLAEPKEQTVRNQDEKRDDRDQPRAAIQVIAPDDPAAQTEPRADAGRGKNQWRGHRRHQSEVMEDRSVLVDALWGIRPIVLEPQKPAKRMR